MEILQEVDGYFSSVAEKQLGEIIVLLPVLCVGNGQKFWQVPSITRHNNSLTAASSAQLLVTFVVCVYVCVCVCVYVCVCVCVCVTISLSPRILL